MFVISLSLLATPSASLALEEKEHDLKLTNEDLSHLQEELVKYDVEAEIAKSLSEKLNSGQLLDSMTMTEEDAVDSRIKKHLDGSEEKLYIYPDGSITVAGVEPDKITAFAEGIKGGSCRTGTGYTNCTNKVVYYKNPGVWEISFRANYTFQRSQFDIISRVYNHSVWMIGGTAQDPSLRMLKSKENSAGPAKARFSTYLNLGGSYGTLTRSVELRVGNNRAKVYAAKYY